MWQSATHYAVVILGAWLVAAAPAAAKPLRVVTTSSAYASIARAVGGTHVTVSYVIEGNQDPHIVRPKPSLAVRLNKADLFVATGLDLEMWAPTLVNMSNNPNIRSGQKGYVSASSGLKIIETPITVSRAEGDVHIYGNPHIHTSPLNGKVIAENIGIGLKKIDPRHAADYDRNLKQFKQEVDRRTFGTRLVKLLGGRILTKLAQRGTLITFLQRKSYQGKPLMDLLGGWMKQALPLRGRTMVTYHKNWGYFTELVGLKVVAYMEPKPGIPPTPGHVASVIQTMRSQHIPVILAANYFDQGKVRKVARRVGAQAVIVPLAPGDQSRTRTFFDQFDLWITQLNEAFRQADARQHQG